MTFAKFLIVALGLLVAISGRADCNDEKSVYKKCHDQKEVYAQALASAKRDGQILIVSFGGEWCPACLEFSKLMHGMSEGLKRSYLYQPISLEPFGSSSGREVLRDFHLPQDVKSYPFIFVVDPMSGKYRPVRLGGLPRGPKSLYTRGRAFTPSATFSAILIASARLAD